MRNFKLVVFTILMGMVMSYAQNKQLLYDFYEIPQSLILNPGVKTPYKWHMGIPGLSGFSFQAGTRDLSVNDLFAQDGIDFTTKFRDKVINGLNQNDDFGYSGQLEIFNGGFRSSKRPSDYYSFGAYGEGFASIFWPKDLAVLAFEGNASNLNRRFNLSHINQQGEAVSVLHFGINRKINDRWTVGARAKIYSSIYEFKSTDNEGYFVTTQGDDNIYRNTLVADVTMRTSGIEEILDIIDEDTPNTQADLASLLLKRSLLGGNLGLGFDFGFTHKLNENAFLTASLLDVGFIYHSGDIKNYTLKGAASNEGVEIRLPEDLTNLNNDIWQDLIDDFERLIPLETDDKTYVSLRPIKLNASYRYNFGQYSAKSKACDCETKPVSKSEDFDYKNALGAHLFVINRPRGPQAAITAFYQKRIGKVLALKTTYTADRYTLTNIGLGLNLQAGPVNFYILGDNILGYQNIPASNYASLQFGFNILSWNSN